MRQKFTPIFLYCVIAFHTRQGIRWAPFNGAQVPATIEIMNPSHVELLQLGAASLDEWRAENPVSRLDLRGAPLSGRNFAGWNLSRALFDHADLAGADLSGADLSEASLKWADLEGAKLQRATLYRATMVGANLQNADLSGAAMYRVSLKDANIEGADFTAATMQKVIMPAEGAR